MTKTTTSTQPNVTHHFQTTASGVKIHYVDAGGTGPRVMLVHGWNNNWYGFTPLIEQLVKHFHVYALDMPGYGESGNLHGSDFGLSAVATCLNEFLSGFDYPFEALISLSMGSAVTAHLCSRYPDITNKLILMGLPLIKRKHFLYGSFTPLMDLVYRIPGMKTLGHKVITMDYYGYFTARLFNMYRYDRDLITKYGLKGRKQTRTQALFGLSCDLAHDPLHEHLHCLRVPTQLIYGRYDKLVDKTLARKIASERPNLYYDEVDLAGHVVSLERPQETAQIIRYFLTAT